MAKTFNSVKVGSYLKIYRPIDNVSGYANVHEYIAEVTNVEIYGDELYISYKTHQFNHTIKVHKNSTSAWVHIWMHTWENRDYFWRKHTEPNCSRRRYQVNYNKIKYSYNIELL